MKYERRSRSSHWLLDWHCLLTSRTTKAHRKKFVSGESVRNEDTKRAEVMTRMSHTLIPQYATRDNEEVKQPPCHFFCYGICPMKLEIHVHDQGARNKRKESKANFLSFLDLMQSKLIHFTMSFVLIDTTWSVT